MPNMSFVMLDRDGVINHDSVHYIKSPLEWHEIEGSAEAIALLNSAGFKIGVATNQSGIGRGYYSEQTLNDIHYKMLKIIQSKGGDIDKIVYCPHLPDDECNCRKPKPGLLYQLADFFGSTPLGKYYIGDKVSDIQAARACGAKPILIESNIHKINEKSQLQDVLIFPSLLEAAKYITHEST